jgi:3-hydroxyisobutyrate dehydrogenase-like beta-hydroxyacid dehydrogenase
MATTVGLLHPGEMGAVVGECLRRGGARVVWASASRSEASRRRAGAGGLEDLGSLTAVVAASDVIFSVCPPGSAVAVAHLVAAERFGGLYVDANAVAPETVRRVGEIVSARGAELVDGGIIGPPPREPGATRLYLAGPRAGDVASLCKGSVLEAIVMPGDIGTASALKMAYAAWTKGSSALLMAVRALAIREGVDGTLRAEWERSQPGLGARSESAVAGNAKKAWRFVGEMEEIARTFSVAGLPAGFHEACAAIYERLGAYKDTPTPPTVAEAAAALVKRDGRLSSASLLASPGRQGGLRQASEPVAGLDARERTAPAAEEDAWVSES